MAKLKYLSSKKNSVEMGSRRIPLFFTSEVVNYFRSHTILINDMITLIQEMDSPEGIDDYRSLNDHYNEKLRDIREYKEYVLYKLDDFTVTAIDLIEKDHLDMVPCYVEELMGAMDSVRAEIEKWDHDLPRPAQQSMPYIA